MNGWHGVVGVGVVLAAMGVAACGSNDDDGAATDAAGATVALHLPDGWTRSGDGLAAAENPADLASDAPTGPVVRATVVPAEGIPVDQLNDFSAGADGEDVGFEDPVERTIDGFDAISITVRSDGRVQDLIATHPPGGQAVMFRVDAPADRFDSLRTMLESVPGLNPTAGD